MTTTNRGAPSSRAAPGVSRTTTGPVLALMIGSLAVIAGLLVIGSAGVVALTSSGNRDLGSFSTPMQRYTVASYAVTIGGLDVEADSGMPFGGQSRAPGRATIRAAAADPNQPIFIGVAPQADVSRYLADIGHSELVDVTYRPFRQHYREVVGSKQPLPPRQQPFWSLQAQGPGAQQIQGELRAGAWAVVVMNADSRPMVAADIQAGLDSPWLGIGGLALLLTEVGLLALGSVPIGIGVRTLTRGD